MWFNEYYQNMQELLTPGETENFALEHFEVSPKEAKHFSVMDGLHGGDGIEPGKYVRLMTKGGWREVIMSDTYMEKYSNLDFVRSAHGNVLIGGLGIGMVVAALLKKPEVTSITIVEKEKEIVQLIGVQSFLKDPKIAIINEDIFNFTTDLKFETIYFDIWNNVCTDNWEEMKKLKRKFRRNLNKQDPNAWISCWKWNEVQWRVQDEKWAGW